MAHRAKKMDIRLRTVENVEAILRRARQPLSRTELLHRLRGRGHGTTRQRLNLALRFLVHLQVARTTARGIERVRRRP